MIPSWIIHKRKNIFSTSLLEQKDVTGILEHLLPVPQVSARAFKESAGSVQLLAQPEAQDTAEDSLETNQILSCVQAGGRRQ